MDAAPRDASRRAAASRAAFHVPNSGLTMLADGQGTRTPHGVGHGCATSRRRKAAGRGARATPASPRSRAHRSIAARSRRGGMPCSTRRRRPCRCVAGCRRHNRGTRRRSAPSPPAPSHRWGRTEVRLDGRRRATETSGDLGDRQALLVTVMARERGGPAALLDTVCARNRPPTITLVPDCYRTRWTFAPGGQGLARGRPLPPICSCDRALCPVVRVSAKELKSPLRRTRGPPVEPGPGSATR
jgi:hypothetical protein